MYIAVPTHVLKIRAESRVSGSSSPTCALSLMVSGIRMSLVFAIPSALATPWLTRGLPCNAFPVFSLRMFFANSLPSSPVLYKRTLHPACSVCLLPYSEKNVLRSVQVLSPGSHRCACLLSPRCVLQVVQIGRKGNRRIVIVPSPCNS